MDNLIRAVLIHECPEPFQALKGALSDLSVESYCVKGCSEAKNLIAQYQPLLVFVDHPIWRKSYADIVEMAIVDDQFFFNMIVVGPLPDIEQYVSAVSQGAFSFVVPPFPNERLTQVVHSAALDALDVTESLAQMPLAHAAT